MKATHCKIKKGTSQSLNFPKAAMQLKKAVIFSDQIVLYVIGTETKMTKSNQL